MYRRYKYKNLFILQYNLSYSIDIKEFKILLDLNFYLFA